MVSAVLPVTSIEVGHHTTANWLGMTVNTDTIYATLVAAAVTLVLAFILRAKVTSTGVPSGVQLFWEGITVQMRGQVQSSMGLSLAPFVLPLVVSLFVFILVANWISVLPCSSRQPREPRWSCSNHQLQISTSCWPSRS